MDNNCLRLEPSYRLQGSAGETQLQQALGVIQSRAAAAAVSEGRQLHSESLGVACTLP